MPGFSRLFVETSMPRLDEFVSSVVKSGLLGPDDLAALRARFNPEPAADAAVRLAELLIAEGKLTLYQAKKLLAGATKGFFLGDYLILRRLGQGGMGKVYLARHTRTGAEVAIKVLPPRKAAEEEQALARFQRETQLSQRAVHPNLARTIEVGHEGDVHYMVMEYVAGDSLFHMVRGKDRGPWGVADATRYFLQVLDGLECAHKAGLVHRDLKPSNLMVTPEGNAKILDLGLARCMHDADASRLTQPNLIVGTLDYASPEQLADAAKADHRSDVYSLGCTMYFTLAGRPPFPGGDAINKIYKQRMEDAPLLERQSKAIPPAFAAIVRKMMAKNPSDRYQNVASLRNDLKRWADPAVVRALVGAEADAIAAVRPPTPSLEDEDLRILDAALKPGESPASSSIREIGDAEAAPAPRNRSPDVPRPAVVVESPKPHPRGGKTTNLWLLQIVAALFVLAAIALTWIVLAKQP